MKLSDKLVALTFCAALLVPEFAFSKANEVGVPTQLLAALMAKHGKGLSAASDPRCRLKFSIFNSAAQQAAIISWGDDCSEWCGTGGCRTLIYVNTEKSWKELTDSVLRNIRIMPSNRGLSFEAEMGGANCAKANASSCFKRGTIQDGLLNIQK